MLVLKVRPWEAIRCHRIIVSILPSTARQIYAIRIKSEGSWIWYSFKIITRQAELHSIYGARLVCVIRILEFFQAFDEAVCIFFRSGPTGCQADDSVIGIIGFPHTVGDFFIEGG